VKRERNGADRVARIRELRDQILPDQSDNSLGHTVSGELIALGDLVGARRAVVQLSSAPELKPSRQHATRKKTPPAHCVAAIVRQGWAPGGWEVAW